MDYAIVVAIEFVYAIASLALISLGLAIVFGMMRIINLAHGGVIGLIIERLIIRHLYGRMVETMLATWGLSLFIVGVLTMIFGNHTEGVPTPLRGIRIGDYQVSGYSLFVIVLSIVVLPASMCSFARPGSDCWHARRCRIPTWRPRSAPIPPRFIP